MLIQYPTEQEEKDRYQLVNYEDLEILQEIDKEQDLDLTQSTKPELVKEEQKSQPSRNRVLSTSSFEDLSKEANDEKMKREALQVWNKEINDEPSVKLFMSEENRIIDDNYISGNSAYPIRQKIDWFSLYAKKAYNFRDDRNLYDKIKTSIQ